MQVALLFIDSPLFPVIRRFSHSLPPLRPFHPFSSPCPFLSLCSFALLALLSFSSLSFFCPVTSFSVLLPSLPSSLPSSLPFFFLPSVLPCYVGTAHKSPTPAALDGLWSCSSGKLNLEFAPFFTNHIIHSLFD